MILFSNGALLCEGDTIEHSLVIDKAQKLSLTLVAIGGGKAQFDIDIRCAGADITLNGVYLCKGEERLNVDVNMRHSVGGSTSNQLFKGIADDSARVHFGGKIVVAHDAQKTEAYQTNRNLQLSDSAVVESLPQLEIYADDVKCSHGATVGALNEDEQFYMRSRGISLQEARRLQMISFIAPAIADLPTDIQENILSRV